jgi:glycosyltransferase involved in cell wall biosynthesis
VVNIPAYNEERSIAAVIERIPRNVNGCHVFVSVIDDGSKDLTSTVARNAGADYVHKFPKNMGVAWAFKIGLRCALAIGADIIVNIDADNQFDPEEIPKLAAPLIENQADVVLGSRFLDSSYRRIPTTKRIGNLAISWIVSILAVQRIRDTQCGFRALSKMAAETVTLSGFFTYTQEMILDLAFRRMRILEVPVTVRYFNERQSRVVKSIPSYTLKILGIILITTLRHLGAILLAILSVTIFSGIALSLFQALL